jgi:hypothetical protein
MLLAYIPAVCMYSRYVCCSHIYLLWRGMLCELLASERGSWRSASEYVGFRV